MHVIGRRALREFAGVLPEAERPLNDWRRTTRRPVWSSFVDVRKNHAYAEAAGELTIFSAGGNQQRLAVSLHYRTGRVLARRGLPHEEYSRAGRGNR